MKYKMLKRRYCSSFFSNESGQPYGRSLLKAKGSAYELGLTKKNTDESFPKAKIMGSSDARDYAMQFYSDDIGIYESMFIIFLNRNNTTIHWAKISQGGVDETIVDPRLICKYAIDCLACAVILVHNHPSGNLKPSDSDNKNTKKVKQMLNVFDIELLDHIIVTEDGQYYSYAYDGGLL